MKVAFGTVVYKEAYNYVKEYLDSLNNQDTSDFDLLLLNDNLTISQLEFVENNLEKQPKILTNKMKLDPNQLRVELIKWARKEKYELLILGDFDDKFSNKRISSVIEEFDSDYGFFYNGLSYFDEHNFFKELPAITDSVDDILEFNYVGLSHSALNLNFIDFELMIDLEKCTNEIFDWYLYSLLLSVGIKGKRINVGKTYYRIHGNNIAGEGSYSESEIIKELNIKIKHYNSLKTKNPKFKEQLDKYQFLKSNIQIGKLDITDFIDKKSYYWWSKINLEGLVQSYGKN